MSRAHSSQRLALEGWPVLLDENTIAYFPFEINLDSIIDDIKPAYDISNTNLSQVLTTGRFTKGFQARDVSQLGFKYLLRYRIMQNILTYSFWFKSVNTKTSTGATNRRYLLIYTTPNDSSNSVSLYMSDGTSPSLTLETKINGLGNICTIPNATINPIDGQWHHVMIEVNASPETVIEKHCSRLWVDGNVSEIGYDIKLNLKGNLHIGNHFEETVGDSTFSECVYDDLVLKNKHYSKTEMLGLYFSNRELYNPYNYYQVGR